VPWLVHAYTASSAVLAFLALDATAKGDYRTAFLWLAVTVVVDASDGFLARTFRVRERLPHFNGARLDDIVDYLTFVFLPVLLLHHSGALPDGWGAAVASIVLLSSAYGFASNDAKTDDHFFTGFPSYWNIVVFYLFLARLPAGINAVILVALAVMVFVPIHYLYPSRGAAYQRLTNLLGVVWGVLILVLLWQFPAVSQAVFWASLVFPLYYVVLSFVLEARRRRGARAA
jgi:phosphatidylcholine synthase